MPMGSRILASSLPPLTCVPTRWGCLVDRCNLVALSDMVLRCDVCAAHGFCVAESPPSTRFVGGTSDCTESKRRGHLTSPWRSSWPFARRELQSSAKDAADGALHKKYRVDSAISVGSHANRLFVAKMVALGSINFWIAFPYPRLQDVTYKKSRREVEHRSSLSDGDLSRHIAVVASTPDHEDGRAHDVCAGVSRPPKLRAAVLPVAAHGV